MTPLHNIAPETRAGPIHFWIVAIDHKLQLARNVNDSTKMRAQKEQLDALLRDEIPKREVRFIAEESEEGKVTIASSLANASDPTIPWINIRMDDAEREAAGIAEALRDRPGHPDNETMETWIESRIPEDVIREDFFIAETLRQAGDAQSILMLLGDMHVEAVGDRLKTMGFCVSTNHDLCPLKRWE
jgi:hypothetical protein